MSDIIEIQPSRPTRSTRSIVRPRSETGEPSNATIQVHNSRQSLRKGKKRQRTPSLALSETQNRSPDRLSERSHHGSDIEVSTQTIRAIQSNETFDKISWQALPKVKLNGVEDYEKWSKDMYDYFLFNLVADILEDSY